MTLKRYSFMLDITLYQTRRGRSATPRPRIGVIESGRGNPMSEKITVYQKPTCTKCRQTLARLTECNIEFEAVNYYQTPLSEDRLRELIDQLSIAPRELLRKDEAVYRELELDTR